MTIECIVKSVSNLTLLLSILVFVLAGLVLVDCVFLYRRISLFRKRQEARLGIKNGDKSS